MRAPVPPSTPPSPLTPWSGLAWRGHDPRWAHEPASGQGAAITGGRFNRKGEPTLYLALSEETAIREVQAGFAHRFQPLTLCAYEVRGARVADLRNHDLLAALGFAPEAPACAWRDDVDQGRVPESWRLADALRAVGADGVLAPSYAAGATSRDLNLVLWRWTVAGRGTGEGVAGGTSGGATVAVIDDLGRLPSPPTTS